MTSQTGSQSVTVYILPNVIRSKNNHTKKFGRLIEYKKIISFQKSCRKCGKETSSRPLFDF